MQCNPSSPGVSGSLCLHMPAMYMYFHVCFNCVEGSNYLIWNIRNKVSLHTEVNLADTLSDWFCTWVIYAPGCG